MSMLNREEILREGARLAPASEITLKVNGEIAEVVRDIAEWMRWKPEDLAQALVATALESWDADEELVATTSLTSWQRYCETGRAPVGWRRKLGKEALELLP